jgi:lycopene beta-cyclase
MDADIILVGAGLASALSAARLSTLPDPPRIIILERSEVPFAGHTWSFHNTDLTQQDRDWVGPLVQYRWDGQEVRFPRYSRTLSTGYATLSDASVARFIASLPNVSLRSASPVVQVEPDWVQLQDGTILTASCVVEASGFSPHPALKLGYQKFLGLEVETAEPHGLAHPIIMDAAVPQLDGYRFLYSLPFAPNRLLIEDTRYSDDPDFDPAALEDAVLQYAAERNWHVRTILRRETGSLPIALAFDADRFWQGKRKDIPRIGLDAGLFHPVTGYSLPEAVATANIIAESWPTTSAHLAARIEAHAKCRARQQSFYRLLNRMLFRAAAPDQRYLVLSRFYRLPEKLIENFYAGRTTRRDMLRILVGKPPVPIFNAVRCLSERRFLQREQR